MTVTVKYGRFEVYSSLALGEPARPYVAVRLQNGGRYYDTFGLVDSGADSTLFHLDWTSVLALDPAPGAKRRTHGLGGDVDVWYFNIYLRTTGQRFPARVGFTEGCPKEFGLLGRDDFFSAFGVGFDQRNTRVLFKALP